MGADRWNWNEPFMLTADLEVAYMVIGQHYDVVSAALPGHDLAGICNHGKLIVTAPPLSPNQTVFSMCERKLFHARHSGLHSKHQSNNPNKRCDACGTLPEAMNAGYGREDEAALYNVLLKSSAEPPQQ